MGMESTVAEIEKAGGAALNLVIRHDALEAAQMLQDKCGIPYHYGTPYGYTGTLRWLEEIAAIIDQEIDHTLVQRLKEKSLTVAPMGGPMGMGMMGKERAKVSIQGDYDMLLGFKQALTELDLDVDNMICSHSLKSIEVSDPAIRHLPKEKDRIELFRSLDGQWCLGSDEMKRFCSDGNYFTLISAPFLSHRQRAAHLPFMGEKGMDYLMELKAEFEAKFDL